MTSPEIPQSAEACCDAQNFGNLITKLLQAKNIDQKDLAWKISLTPSTFNRYIHETPFKILLTDIDNISHHLPCHPLEKAELTKALICHLLTHAKVWKLDTNCEFLKEVPKR